VRRESTIGTKHKIRITVISYSHQAVIMYVRFVTGAACYHVRTFCYCCSSLSCGVGVERDSKVHLMWKHVVVQMLLDGGLFHKREDWVERLHQVTSLIREQHRRMKDMVLRCVSMARLH